MAIQFNPQCGAILICDFNGLKQPEMIKRRPVIVVSNASKYRRNLCTIVPTSTTAPSQILDYHYLLKTTPPLPKPYDEVERWVKCDMLYTMSFDRLFLPFLGKDDAGKRIYDQRHVSDYDLGAIYKCISRSLGL